MMIATDETTERIIGELEEIGSHKHKAIRFVEKGHFHEALQELTNMQLRISEAEHLIRGEMKK